MSIVRWNPSGNLLPLQDRWNRMFEEFFGAPAGDEEVAQQIWAPRTDLSESENEYTIQVDLPGMKKDDVDITYSDGVLTIKGERRLEKERKDKNLHVCERAYGSFTRSFNLRSAVDSEKISAKFDNGVLTVNLPKHEKVKPRQIKINA